jgi:hypothetical protein
MLYFSPPACILRLRSVTNSEDLPSPTVLKAMGSESNNNSASAGNFVWSNPVISGFKGNSSVRTDDILHCKEELEDR